jgi:hypothetical protein
VGAGLAIDRFLNSVPAEMKKAEALGSDLSAALDDKTAVAGLTAMLSQRLPEVENREVGSAKVREMMKAIENNVPESETVKLAGEVKSAELEEAFATARANAAAFDAAIRPINSAADRLNGILVRRMALGRALERSARDLAAAGTDAAGEGTAMVPEIRLAAAQLAAVAAKERSAQAEIYNAFTSARLRFGAKRYEHEARYNLVPSNCTRSR